MGTRDPRLDAYLAASADFARPILAHLRALVHEAVPDVVETIKWGMPTFEHHGIVAGMAAFKAHCAFSLWKADELAVPLGAAAAGGMGRFGRLTTLADLPDDAAIREVLRALAARNASRAGRPRRATPAAAGAAAPSAKTAAKATAKPAARRAVVAPPTPDDLAAALAANAAAHAAFERFAPSHRREYVEWITEAKRAETRARRVAQTVEWLAEGKSRNWKYERPATGA